MAITFKEATERLNDQILSVEEKDVFSSIEKYVDKEILRTFDNSEVCIDFDIFEFQWHPSEDRHLAEFKPTRKSIMSKQLMKKYKDAGWNVELINNAGQYENQSKQFYLLTGKKQ